MTHLNIAKNVIDKQAEALEILSKNLPSDLEKLTNHILSIQGRVILIGMGKSGYIAKKIAASLASTGTPSFYIHPSEASHGDLGMITKDDLVMMLSKSGETQELFNIIDYCKQHNIKIASITMKDSSTLAQNSDFNLILPKQNEATELPAPTISALMTLSLGDALVTALHEDRKFTKDHFKKFHPGGKIGTNLLKVSEIMHIGDKLPTIHPDESFTNSIVKMNAKCLGCALIIDNSDQLIGIITDGDLRRHIDDELNTLKAQDVMTHSPKTIEPDLLAIDALKIMNDKAITILPIVDNNKLVGVIHIHDILNAGVD